LTDKYYIMNKQEEAIIILIVLIIIKIKLLFSFFSFLDHFLEFPVVEFSVSVLIKLGHDSINLVLRKSLCQICEFRFGDEAIIVFIQSLEYFTMFWWIK